MIVCYIIQPDLTLKETEDYVYDALYGDDNITPTDDFGEDNVKTIAPGVLFISDEDERGDRDRERRDMIVADSNAFSVTDPAALRDAVTAVYHDSY